MAIKRVPFEVVSYLIQKFQQAKKASRKRTLLLDLHAYLCPLLSYTVLISQFYNTKCCYYYLIIYQTTE